RLPRRPRSPVHLADAVRYLRGAWGSAVDGADRGVLGQRDGRVVLGHAEDRVLRPPVLADSGRGPPRGRPVDRDRLQPSPAALQPRLRHPGRVRLGYRPRSATDLTTLLPGPRRMLNCHRLAGKPTIADWDLPGDEDRFRRRRNALVRWLHDRDADTPAPPQRSVDIHPPGE